jgi:hypothetical protein
LEGCELLEKTRKSTITIWDGNVDSKDRWNEILNFLQKIRFGYSKEIRWDVDIGRREWGEQRKDNRDTAEIESSEDEDWNLGPLFS